MAAAREPVQHGAREQRGEVGREVVVEHRVGTAGRKEDGHVEVLQLAGDLVESIGRRVVAAEGDVPDEVGDRPPAGDGSVGRPQGGALGMVEPVS